MNERSPHPSASKSVLPSPGARVLAGACLGAVLSASGSLAGQELRIGIIDLFGLTRVTPAQARAAITIREGDTVSFDSDDRPASFAESERKLATLPGVKTARTNIVCCDHGDLIVYVGIEEAGAQPMRVRDAPTGDARLPPEVVRSGELFLDAQMAAIERGVATEDRRQGHALSDDPATRAIQERFLIYAARDLPLLREVLQTSADAAHRAAAATILGYAPDKQAVVDDLVGAMRDPDENVRNNAMRALMVFAEAAPGAVAVLPRVPAEPFVDWLHSPTWTDRNKAVLALDALSRSRDPRVLERLRVEALDPLVEMARWKSEGHAWPAYAILARIAGVTDEAALQAWERGDRDTVIRSATGVRR